LVPLEMSTIDIEAPGADEAALKAAIQALVPISTTTISSPVNYVDITLPSGYASFKLEVSDLYRESGGVPANVLTMAAFSQDAGVTWLEDILGDNESHFLCRIRLLAGAAIASQNFLDPWLTIDGITGPPSGRNISVNIYPGSATTKAGVTAISMSPYYEDGSGTGLSVMSCVCLINTARVNALRIAVQSGGGPSAPSVSQFLHGGTLSLYGVL
jgi:hypothetical protein